VELLTWVTEPKAWVSLATLTVLEIVLGIDNIIFIAIVAGRLPPHQQDFARKLGLSLALIMRLALLASIAWIVGLTRPLFEVLGHPVSWRDLILIGGGLFLLAKGTREIHSHVEGEHEVAEAVATATFSGVIAQILLLDIVFSLDSVITAVGIARHFPVMALAVIIAVGVMLWAAGPVSAFVDRHPTVKMLALSFLLLIGVVLVADGLHFDIPRGYIYFAIAFSLAVEALNMAARRRRERRGVKARHLRPVGSPLPPQ
jgi:predicted tellurium resistance membrane protein TerC